MLQEKKKKNQKSFLNFLPSISIRNNNSNIFIVLDALKSLFCFSLNIDVNDILKYLLMFYLNEQSPINRSGWACTFSWNCNKIWVRVENSLFQYYYLLLEISENHNVGLLSSLHFKFGQIIYLFKTFIMLWRINIYAVGYLVMNFQGCQPN